MLSPTDIIHLLLYGSYGVTSDSVERSSALKGYLLILQSSFKEVNVKAISQKEPRE